MPKIALSQGNSVAAVGRSHTTYRPQHVASLVLVNVSTGRAVRELARYYRTIARTSYAPQVDNITRHLSDRGIGKEKTVAILSRGYIRGATKMAVLSVGATPVSTPLFRKEAERRGRPYVTKRTSLSEIATRLYNKRADIIIVSTPKELRAALKIATSPVKVRTAEGNMKGVRLPVKEIITTHPMKIPKEFKEKAHCLDTPKSDSIRVRRTHEVLVSSSYKSVAMVFAE